MSRKSFLSTLEFARLNHACMVVAKAFGHYPYLVGSSTETRDFRDVDLRLILPDEEFDYLFGETLPNEYWSSRRGFPGGLWGVICLSIAHYLSDMSGLPIDFQIQRQSTANAKYDGTRNPMGIEGRQFAGGGDATKAAAAVPVEEKQMGAHKVRVDIEDGGLHFSVICPFDPEDRSRPCWPTILDSDGEPEPESDGCVYIGWCDNLRADEWHHGLVVIECDAEFDWHYDTPSVRLSSPAPVVAVPPTPDVRENTRRNMEKYNIPQGVGLPEGPPHVAVPKRRANGVSDG